MSRALHEFEALNARMDVFLSRLERRGQEVGDEALAVARTMRTSDAEEFSRSFTTFSSGISAQLMTLVTKAQATFDEQFSMFEDMEDDAVEQAYEALEERVEQWQEMMTWRAEHLFDEFAAADAYQTWDAAVAEWKSLASRFTCPQCAAPVPVPQFYTVSVYLPCQGCGTQVTFTPSEAMQGAAIAAEAIAEDKARPYERAHAELDADPQAEFPPKLAALARYKAVVQCELEALIPMLAAKTFPGTLDALTEWHGYIEDAVNVMDEHDRDPREYEQVETTYYRSLMALAEVIREFRAEGRPRAADLVRGMTPRFGRRGCQVAAAIANDTYTDDMGRAQLERAARLDFIVDQYGQRVVIR